MQKLLLASILLAIVVLPAWTARHPDPRKGLRRTLILFAGFNVAYLIALRFIYPRL